MHFRVVMTIFSQPLYSSSHYEMKGMEYRKARVVEGNIWKRGMEMMEKEEERRAIEERAGKDMCFSFATLSLYSQARRYIFPQNWVREWVMDDEKWKLSKALDFPSPLRFIFLSSCQNHSHCTILVIICMTLPRLTVLMRTRETDLSGPRISR